MVSRSALRSTINGVTIDLHGERLRDASGRAVDLRPQTFAVLRHLVENADRIVSKDELLSAVWPGLAVTDDSIVQCIHEIRRALRDERHVVLKTVPKRGYRLTLPTRSAALRNVWLAPIVAVVLAIVAAATWWSRPTGTTRTALSVAVLPFDDLDGAAQQARFASAFTEDLITELARSRAVTVIARNSVETYAGKAVDVRQIAKDLGVSHVLEGSLELQPARIRVTAQLIDAETGSHVWAERYERPATDVFAVRDEILTRLVGTLTGYEGPLWQEWTAAAKRRPPGSLEAVDYLLLAREPYRRHDQSGIDEARQLILKAIELDPQLASAWNFLAHTYMQDALNGWGDSARAWELHHDATRRAAELDPADGEIQEQLGTMYFQRGDVLLGSEAWKRALALAPNDALVNRGIGTQLAIALGTERAAEGIELVERALYELDPLHPPYQWFSLGYPLYFAGRYAEAVEAFRKVPEPWLEVRVMLTLALAKAGLIGAARDQAEAVLKLDPAFNAEAWIANDIYQPGGSSAELFVGGARAAGLPICAPNADAIEPHERLAACEQVRKTAENSG